MDSPGPTSIRFGAAGWRAIMARDFTFANVRLATQAVAEYLKTELADPNSPIHRRAPAVIIARDCRFLGPQFALAAAEVLTAAGLSPLLCNGATPAPVLALAIRQRKAIGGIYIAAGHNPAGVFRLPILPPRWRGRRAGCHRPHRSRHRPFAAGKLELPGRRYRDFPGQDLRSAARLF